MGGGLRTAVDCNRLVMVMMVGACTNILSHIHKQQDPKLLNVGHTNICSVFGIEPVTRSLAVDCDRYAPLRKPFTCLVGLVVASTTAEQSCVRFSGRTKCYWVFHQAFLSSKKRGWICARLMAIGSPSITWDLKT